MNEYKVTKTEDGKYEAFFHSEEGGGRFLGTRGKYKIAQRLCEQTAGRELDWKSLGGGNYVGR